MARCVESGTFGARSMTTWHSCRFKGKSVLEVGTADGYLCFEMEKRGASVIGYDLSEEHPWDVVPYGGIVTEEQNQDRRKTLRGLNNAWWLAHEVFGSNARVVYGTVYDLPPGIGSVDIATFGSVLLHLRDPFLALQNAAALARESIIVTDLIAAPCATRASHFSRESSGRS